MKNNSSWKTKLSGAGILLALLSLGAGCAPPTGSAAFLILEPRFMRKPALPAVLSARSADHGAMAKVDSVVVMRAAEADRTAEDLAPTFVEDEMNCIQVAEGARWMDHVPHGDYVTREYVTREIAVTKPAKDYIIR